ncbi:uncharacterized protein LOC135834568 [Planococcus citri]|uniref:uncharacterized protein LOC135834568 n=1 Tax=Planococcus citri TaxID=170843 RepID=UPI0031F8CBB7
MEISPDIEVYPDHAPKTEYCQYGRKDGTICSEGIFLQEGPDFTYLNNGSILYHKKLFPKEMYTTETGLDHTIFLCGESTLAFDIRRINHEVILSCISIIFLLVYLFNDLNQENWKRFQNKVLYSYSITLIMLYISFIGSILTTVCILWYIRKILRICYCLWAVLMSFEFWRVTYFTLKHRKISSRGQNKRYWVYCFLGYILPLIFAIGYYLSKRKQMNECPRVKGFIREPCPHLLTGRVNVYVIWQVIRFITFTVLLFVLIIQVGVFIYFDKNSRIKSTHSVNRNYLLVLIKMAYMMGIYWMIFVYFIIIVPDSFRWHDSLRSIIDAVFLYSHGVFMYFAFGIKKETLDWLRDKYRNFTECFRNKSTQNGDLSRVRNESTGDEL